MKIVVKPNGECEKKMTNLEWPGWLLMFGTGRWEFFNFILVNVN